MPVSVRVPLGAPGIYPFPETPARTLTGVRLDVCAFIGVAPRGPVRVPVIDEKWRDDRPIVEPERPRRRTVGYAVESFDEYRTLYGGFEGPGLLPYAVAAFFENGGIRAYVARVVHEYNDAVLNSARVSVGNVPGVSTVAGPVRLRARNEGRWGDKLSARISFTSRPVAFESATAQEIKADASAPIVPGSLLRCTLPGGVRALRFASNVLVDRTPNAAPRLVARFDLPLSVAPEALEVVEGILDISDADGRTERIAALGLSPLHPRWMATSLCFESILVYPDASWIQTNVNPDSADLISFDPALPQFQGGADDYPSITPEDFFDPDWLPGNDEPGSGVHCLTQLSDLTQVLAPDLYSPGPLVPIDRVFQPASVAGPEFAPCVDLRPPPEQEAPVPDLDGLRLNPLLPGELRAIQQLQLRLVSFADILRNFIVLIDVPPGLNQRQILRWRSVFDSSYAAAYHPWLTVSRRNDGRDALVRIPPSAVAAGIIAKREIELGVPTGAGNVLASEVVGVDDRVSDARHDELHPVGINVYLLERDGVRLTAARTLSRDPAFRQLSVRRLMILLRRTLDQNTQWVVFEPNNASLRADLRNLLKGFLRGLFEAGAFRGATEEESFFVRCDDSLHPQRVLDAGQLIAEIGVAPSEPLEFILLRLARDGDGTLGIEE